MKIARTQILIFLIAIGLLVGQPAAMAASGSTTVAAAVAPSLSSVQLSATDVIGGNPVTGTVTLTSAAAAGGMLVALSSDNTAAATAPASVTVPAGSTRATFVVSTSALANSQSALIIGTAGVTSYAIITVRPAFQFSNGSISIVPGGNGSGTITSQPAGINCNIGTTVGGVCSAFFPVGTVVRLTAQAAAGSKFQGWRGLPGCGDPSRITVGRGTNISCQPGFALK